MKIANDVRYSKSHEWVKELEEGKVQVGITDYAQGQLGNIVFVNLPFVEDEVTAGETFTDVESVKAVSDLYSPVTGVISATNEALEDAPEGINEDAFAAWIIEVSDVSEYAALMSPAEYEAYCATL